MKEDEKYKNFDFGDDIYALEEPLNCVPDGTILVLPYAMLRKKGRVLLIHHTVDEMTDTPFTLATKKLSRLKKELEKINYTIKDERIYPNN